MMKRILLMLVMALSTSAVAQDSLVWDNNGSLIFTDVVEVEGVDASELYTRARQWFGEIYRSANNVLQMDDREGGVLLGKAINSFVVTNMGMNFEIKLHYSISVFLKDGRYKYEIKDMYYSGNTGGKDKLTDWITDEKVFRKNGSKKPLYASFRSETVGSVTNLIASLNQAMTKTISSEANSGDDW